MTPKSVNACVVQGNLRSAGFTIEERESFEANLLEGVGLVDTFRRQHPNTVAYTYWAYRSFARKANRGMRKGASFGGFFSST